MKADSRGKNAGRYKEDSKGLINGNYQEGWRRGFLCDLLLILFVITNTCSLLEFHLLEDRKHFCVVYHSLLSAWVSAGTFRCSGNNGREQDP